MEWSVRRVFVIPVTSALVAPTVKPSTAVVRVAALLAVLAATFFVAKSRGWLDYEHVAAVVRELRTGQDRGTAAAIYVASFGAAVALGFPATPAILVGGALFGAGLGSVLSWAGGMIASVAGYWLARLIGKDSLKTFFCRHRALDRLAKEQGFWTMLRLRIVPVMPLAVLNFVAGITCMNQRRYLLATALGLIPSMVVYSYFADALLSGIGDARKDVILRLAIGSVVLLGLSFAVRGWGQGRDERGETDRG